MSADLDDLVIHTTALRKVFRSAGRKVVAVDGLDLAVPRGGVHGFLGPNGSGKTTTIRMLLGLARPTSGSARLFGNSIDDNRPALLARVGALVEEPAFLGSFTGRKNLALLGHAVGVDKHRINEVLDIVGLRKAAGRRYAGYSLGMKQRLGIAAALLRSPELLILDEPTNGLDPAGIRDIRELVRALGESDVTVLLSSHNLAEVQQVCDRVSIVSQGSLLASGLVSELLGESVSRTRIGVRDPARAATLLEGAGYSAAREGDDLIVHGHEHPEHLTELLAKDGVYVHELSEIRPDLETFFLDLTENQQSQDETQTAPEAGTA